MALMEVDNTLAVRFASENVLSRDVLSRYNSAAKVAGRCIASIVAGAVSGASVATLCHAANAYILAETANFSDVEDKGIAYPATISVNNCIACFSPNSDHSLVLNAGDVVKIELAVSVDGYVCAQGHTHIVPVNPALPTLGAPADAVCAAHFAAEVAMRMLVPGTVSTDITAAIEAIAAEFKCTPVKSIGSHLMRRHLLEGTSVIPSLTNVDNITEPCVIKVNDIWCIDILMTTAAEPVCRELDEKPTVFKRNIDQVYPLKMKAAKTVFGEILQTCPVFPFALSQLQTDQKVARLGLGECVNHGLVIPFPVVFDRAGSVVAQTKLTVAVTANGIFRISLPLPSPYVQSDSTLSDTYQQIMRRHVDSKSL